MAREANSARSLTWYITTIVRTPFRYSPWKFKTGSRIARTDSKEYHLKFLRDAGAYMRETVNIVVSLE